MSFILRGGFLAFRHFTIHLVMLNQFILMRAPKGLLEIQEKDRFRSMEVPFIYL